MSSFPHNVRIFGGTHPHQLTFCMCAHARSLTVVNFNLPLNHAHQQAKGEMSTHLHHYDNARISTNEFRKEINMEVYDYLTDFVSA